MSSVRELKELDDLIASNRHPVPVRLTVTGAIRPGEWLCISVQDAGLTLYVADEDGPEARRLWPFLPEYVINNTTGVSDRICVN